MPSRTSRAGEDPLKARAPIEDATGPTPRRLVMIVTGFPNADDPVAGIFNKRAAQGLSRTVPVSVVHLRSWKPGRRRIKTSNVEGLSVTTVTVPQIPRVPLLNLALYRTLGWSRVRRVLEGCDVIHSVGGAFAGILASHWARRAGKHHVTQVIGSDVNTLLPRMQQKGAVAGWENHIHGVACNSEALARAVLGLYPNAKNVRVVRRGVDLQWNQPVGPVAGPLAGKPPVRYLFLGGFDRYPELPHGTNTKGGMTLLAAWQRAEQELILAGASLLIAGGPGSALGPLARWRATLREPDRVFLAGAFPPDVVASYIRSADAVLIPSLEEGLPNVAMEASACGKAVLASDVGGNREVIVDGETGVLLAAGDEKGWASALVTYANRADALSQMGSRSRLQMESLFDSNAYPAEMLDLYRAALSEPLS